MRAKLNAVKTEMRRRMHHPIPEQGHWLASVLAGTTTTTRCPTTAPRFSRSDPGHLALASGRSRRRSQKGKITWERMRRLADRWLPPPANPAPLARTCASTPEPKGGAQCVRRARWDLCGGPSATAVPTAIVPADGVAAAHSFWAVPAGAGRQQSRRELAAVHRMVLGLAARQVSGDGRERLVAEGFC